MDDGAVQNAASNNLRFAASVAEFSMLLRKDEFKGDAAYEQVIEVSKAAIGADKEGYRSEFIRLVRLAQNLQMTELQTDLGN
jgi:Ca-activated chloride channel family protein